MGGREPHRDDPAKGMTEKIDGRQAAFGDEERKIIYQMADGIRVSAPDLRAVAVTALVIGDDAAVCRESGRYVGPVGPTVGETVSSTNGGSPQPHSSKTRS